MKIHQMTRRIVNIIGGRKINYWHGCFAADALRRSILVAPDTEFSTYSYVSVLSTGQYRGMRDVILDCEAEGMYKLPGNGIGKEDCQRFSERCINLSQFGQSLQKFKQKEIVGYIAGNGTREGRVMCGMQPVALEIFYGLGSNQKILMIIDACCGNLWVKNAPSNVSIIGGEFTSCLSTEDRIKDDNGPVGSLLQWALDRAIEEYIISGGEWIEHLLHTWNRITWHKSEYKNESKLTLHNINERKVSFPSFYNKTMSVSPKDALSDFTHMFELDILGINYSTKTILTVTLEAKKAKKYLKQVKDTL